MKRNIILTLIVIFSSVNAFSQSDTLNQFDSRGKKTGWWITYLDDNLRVLKDSVGATHCMYNYYRRDIFLYRFGEGLGKEKVPVIFPENNTMKLGSYTLLNGTYIRKYESGKTRSVLTAVAGFMTNFKKYYPTGELEYEIIVSKKCGAPLQHCIMEYNEDGTLKGEWRTRVPPNK